MFDGAQGDFARCFLAVRLDVLHLFETRGSPDDYLETLWLRLRLWRGLDRCARHFNRGVCFADRFWRRLLTRQWTFRWSIFSKLIVDAYDPGTCILSQRPGEHE